MAKIRRIPKRLHFPFGYIVTVVQVPPKHDWLLDVESGTWLDACWDATNRRIALNKQLPVRRKIYLICHEMQHTLVDMLHELIDTGEARA